MSFANTCSLYKTVKSVSYIHSIGRHDEQNILKFDLAVFSLKHKGLKLNRCQIHCVLFSFFLTLSAFLTTVILLRYFLPFMVHLEMVD